MRISRVHGPDGSDLAFIHTPAMPAGQAHPPLIFCGGYKSDMFGTKASFLQQCCERRGQAYLRFDYGGHGASGGAFEEGTIGQWAHDARTVIHHVFPDQKAVIVGSSMGGWIGLLLADQYPEMFAAFIGVAAAPDFTEDLAGQLSPQQWDEFMTQGYIDIAAGGSEPLHFTKKFYEEAKRHLVLEQGLRVDFPVRLLQGKGDAEVPWQTAEKIRAALRGPETQVLYIEDGDHRLSRPQDLELMDRIVRELSGF